MLLACACLLAFSCVSPELSSDQLVNMHTAAGSAFPDRDFVLKAVFAFAETAAGQRERGGHSASERRGTIDFLLHASAV